MMAASTHKGCIEVKPVEIGEVHKVAEKIGKTVLIIALGFATKGFQGVTSRVCAVAISWFHHVIPSFVYETTTNKDSLAGSIPQ